MLRFPSLKHIPLIFYSEIPSRRSGGPRLRGRTAKPHINSSACHIAVNEFQNFKHYLLLRWKKPSNFLCLLVLISIYQYYFRSLEIYTDL
eukprot:UN21672